jgi:predicted outer membrane protein
MNVFHGRAAAGLHLALTAALRRLMESVHWTGFGLTDAQIAGVVFVANQTEIAAGELALRRTQSRSMQALAGRIVAEHGQANQEIVALTQRLAANLQRSATSDALTKQSVDDLARLNEVDTGGFDEAYLDREVAYLQQLVKTVDAFIRQIARHQGRSVYAFTREGDVLAQALAMRLGACWAGSSTEQPPEPLDAALLFAPVGALVPAALKAVAKGGTVVCGGIHMSDIPSFPYAFLWGERRVVSVANLTREDGRAFMRIAGGFPLEVATTAYSLTDANQALDDLRHGRVRGAAVLNVPR